MRNLLLYTLAIVALTAHGQNEVTFKTHVKSGKVYTTNTTNYIEAELNVSGNEEVTNRLKANGTKFPMIMEATQDMKTIMTTGSVTSGNMFPARMVYDKSIASQKMNGNETIRDESLSGLIVEGFYDEGNIFRVDTVISARITEENKRVLKLAVESIQEKILFPDKPMKVGDSFHQQLPMEFPVAGLSVIKMVIVTDYTLKDITNGTAKFDIFQTLSLDLGIDQTNVISASGEGTGVSEFDMVNSVISRYESNLTMNMKVTVNELIVDAQMDIQSKQFITID